MKGTSYLVTALAAAVSVFAGPIQKRAYSDADILNYALTLEHLEDKFYREGLANFTQADFAAAGYDATFYQNLKEVSYDETTHVAFLTSALKAAGATPVLECTYAFGVTSPATFIATASILEGVGVSAYLGAAASITSKAYLTAAGSILTVEARHNAYIRAAMKARPFPQAFDTPLDFDQVYTLAAPFIVACPPNNPSLGSLAIKAFPSLTVTSTGTILTGSTIVVEASTGIKWSGPVYAAWASVTGPKFVPADAWGGDGESFEVVVPAGVHGQSYVLLTSSGSTVTDDDVLAGPAVVMVGGTDGFPSVV